MSFLDKFHQFTVDARYNEIVGRHTSHPRYSETAVYRNGAKAVNTSVYGDEKA